MASSLRLTTNITILQTCTRQNNYMHETVQVILVAVAGGLRAASTYVTSRS